MLGGIFARCQTRSPSMENVLTYQLISLVLCPFEQRSVITLKVRRVPFEIIYIDLQNPPEWFRAISPLG